MTPNQFFKYAAVATVAIVALRYATKPASPAESAVVATNTRELFQDPAVRMIELMPANVDQSPVDYSKTKFAKDSAAVFTDIKQGKYIAVRPIYYPGQAPTHDYTNN